jgi:hypothetical protein
VTNFSSNTTWTTRHPHRFNDWSGSTAADWTTESGGSDDAIFESSRSIVDYGNEAANSAGVAPYDAAPSHSNPDANAHTFAAPPSTSPSQNATSNDVLIPAATPFGYNVGINYETDVDGRTGRSITADLNQITQYFELVRTYHDTADPNSTTPTIDPNELQVIQYAMTHPAMRLVMGTYDSALVTGTTGSFGPGLMDSSAYTDAWVQMLIAAFGGSTEAVEHSLKTILLGNEPDLPETFIPGPSDPSYSTYVNTWIPTALANLEASLTKAGLGNIPVSVSLAFSPVSAPTGDSLSTATPQYIAAHWSASWDGGHPFVLYNQYSNSSPPTFNDITGYLQQVAASPSVDNEVFLGETGVQSPGGNDAQEAAFYQQMFAFLGGEQQNSGVTLPAFAFQAFDLPAFNQSYGLFSQDANSQPTGLKPGISIPSWVAQPLPGAPDDFTGSGISDILFRNDTTGDTGFYQMSNDANAGWRDVGASSTAYSAVGTGDFYGGGTDDILFRNNVTGDTGFYNMSNGANAGWVDVGPSSAAYTVVRVGDFTGNGTDDILFRNNATGDTGFYQMSNGVNTGWHDVGGSSTAYSAVGVGDFTGNGTDDILFRNNSTGDTGFFAIVNGVNTGWHDIGGSSTAYAVVGVGDFMGKGTSDILFRNNATGDTGFYAIGNGVNTGWHDVGASSPAYSVVAVGDYMGNGTSDILFRNNATGDTGFYAISNGVNTGWHDVGASSTAYKVVA